MSLYTDAVFRCDGNESEFAGETCGLTNAICVQILSIHVASSALKAADLSDGQKLPTLGGGELTATVVDGGVVLTDATGGTASVTAVDVEASNGLVHVIDTVLMPQ